MKLTAAECVEALRARYAPPSHAFLEQVGNGTGWKANRWADAVALCVWPSLGLVLHGFEVKVSRKDWELELSQPKKSAAIRKYCDHWWLVAPAGLVSAQELPPQWGMIEVLAETKTRIAVGAPKLEPVVMDRGFLAAILRRHSGPTRAYDAKVAAERQAARERQKDAEAARKRANERWELEGEVWRLEMAAKKKGLLDLLGKTDSAIAELDSEEATQ